ncbi:MAG: hypothetical protein K2Y29_06010 [Beijerinckiaceae bacterium]|nr:hypothetical protein [Beijerinckiaceae bacterium]
MSKKINLDPVLKHIAKKLIEDRQSLSRILDSHEPQGMRGFEEQERLLEHIQAGVRALDVLEGRVKLEGVKAPYEAPAPANAGPIDMEKLAEALRPNGAAH